MPTTMSVPPSTLYKTPFQLNSDKQSCGGLEAGPEEPATYTSQTFSVLKVPAPILRCNSPFQAISSTVKNIGESVTGSGVAKVKDTPQGIVTVVNLDERKEVGLPLPPISMSLGIAARPLRGPLREPVPPGLLPRRPPPHDDRPERLCLPPLPDHAPSGLAQPRLSPTFVPSPPGKHSGQGDPVASPPSSTSSGLLFGVYSGLSLAGRGHQPRHHSHLRG